MTLSSATLQRLPTIKQGLLLNKTIEQIAQDCGVGSITIDRDLAKFRASPDFEDWLREEWTRLHYIVIHENPELAYMQLTRLLGQTITHRIEKDIRITELKVHATWDNKFNQPPSQSTTTTPTQDKETSTTLQPDTASLPVDADGAKTTAPSTKPSNTASPTVASSGG